MFKQHANAGFAPQYEKIGGFVNVTGQIAPTKLIVGSADRYDIATLPEGFRPAHEEDFVCQGSTTGLWLLRILPNGQMQFERYRRGDGYADVGPDNWLTFSATFPAA